MRVGITGARGRLAPLIANHYRARRDDVVLFSRVGGDGVLDLKEIGNTHCEMIVHCAWSGVPITAESNPGLSGREDLPLLRQLIEQTGKRNTTLVFLSTAAVYGDTGHEPATETCPPAPLGAYAHSKLASEELLLQASPSRSLVLRVTNLLGEGAHPARPQGILPRLFAAAREGVPVELWGDGTATKDYLHCMDFLSAMEALVDGGHRGIFNVASGESVSLLELIRLVEACTGSKVPVVHRDHYPWDVSHSLVSGSRLRETTGWQPELNVATAVERCLRAMG